MRAWPSEWRNVAKERVVQEDGQRDEDLRWK